MTTRAISKKPRSYTLKKDRGKEGAPVFQIRSLDIFEIAEISETQNIVFNEKKGEEQSFSFDLKSTVSSFKKHLVLGLLGWENLKNEDGEDVPFTEGNICLLPFDVMTELVSEINGKVSEEDEKNSDTPSS